MASPPPAVEPRPWYRDVCRAQWLILLLASAGWVFDVYEGQIFNITRGSLLAELLPPEGAAEAARFYGDVFLGVFLVGGALGGILFGALADRWGRRPVLVLTILTYSIFSGLTALAQDLWHVAALRFLVAVGVGGEWSVAAAMVAEAFPGRGRAQAGSIFHASSILGTWMAGLAGWAVGAQWRYGYLLGILPTLLVVALRVALVETKAGPRTTAGGGSVRQLVADPRWRRRALLGLLLAAVGLGTFWGVTVEGQRLAQEQFVRDGVPAGEAQDRAKLAYALVESTGGGVGLLAFGPLAARWGRRYTFLAFHAAAFAVVPLTCYAPASSGQLLALLPVYGFCTLGLHAGYAICFPELFPTHLRATGAGVCFNGGRVVAASVLVFSGWLKEQPGIDTRLAVTLLAGLFLVGMVLAWLLPETKGQPLPE
jgi:MFS family permease